MQAMDSGDLELERRLDSYARSRLSPDPQSTARVRARVMREARLQYDAARIAAHVTPAIAAAHRSWGRRLAMPLLAASVWLGIAVGSISAAQPGGPLYPTRLWIETSVLPASGPQRAQAELNRLDARLGEAVSAAARGDRGAVSAALDAYGQIADDALAASLGDQDLEARVSAALDTHRAVLTAVAAGMTDKGNATAAAAIEASIERAIDHNAAVIDRLGAKGSPGSNGSGAGTGTGSGGGGNAGGAGNGDGQPAKTPKPTPDQPDHTPNPQSH